MPEEKQESKLTLQHIVSYAKISATTPTNNPHHSFYSLTDLLDSKDDFEKREHTAWINELKREIVATGFRDIPNWGKEILKNYQSIYEDSLMESKVSTLIDIAKEVGYESPDFSNVIKPTEKYKDIKETYEKAEESINKKIETAEKEGKRPQLTEEEQKIQDKYDITQILKGMIAEKIQYSYITKNANQSKEQVDERISNLNKKYKLKAT